MKKGFSLVEVMISILLVCLVTAGTVKMLMASSNSGVDSNLKTYAAMLSHSKLNSLRIVSLKDSDVSAGWHMDAANPIVLDNRNFYRCWIVSANKDGSRLIKVVVTWDGSCPSSESDLNGNGVKKFEISGTRDAFMP